MRDIRLTNALALARTRGEQSRFYAARAKAWGLLLGDAAAVEEAISLGALEWEPEPAVYAHSAAPVVQLQLFDEAA